VIAAVVNWVSGSLVLLVFAVITTVMILTNVIDSTKEVSPGNVALLGGTVVLELAACPT
jgi:hypothetical protein